MGVGQYGEGENGAEGEQRCLRYMLRWGDHRHQGAEVYACM